MMSNGRSRLPFTSSQWQELEQQALVFKYMASGMPIPPDLLFTITTSFNSSVSAKLLLHQYPQHIGWNGFGRKIEVEPGRCRRTDGKKWRCSKDAYPDSKYCERHMHRGRNRSRKPVETPTNSAIRMNKSSSITKNTQFSPSTANSRHSISSSEPHFLYPPGSSFEANVYPHSPRNRIRHGHGTKGESTDEHALFSEAKSNPNISVKDSCWKLTIGSSLSQMKHNPCHPCSHLEISSEQYQSERGDHQPKKVTHHFLDECPLKPNHSHDQFSTQSTQLSISTPNSLHDFFIT